MGNYVSYVERASKLYVKDILAKIPGVKVEKIDVNPQLLLQDLLEFHIQLSFEKKGYYCVMNAMTWKAKGYDNPYILAISFSSFYEGNEEKSGWICINPLTRESDAKALGIELENEDEFYKQLGTWHQHFISAKDGEHNLNPSPLDVILTYEQNARADYEKINE